MPATSAGMTDAELVPFDRTRCLSRSALADKVDKNVFERALRGVEIAEPDARIGEIIEQGRDARLAGVRVVGVGQLAPAGAEREMVVGEPRRYCGERLAQVQRELFLAELAHQLGLVLHQNDLALVDHP